MASDEANWQKVLHYSASVARCPHRPLYLPQTYLQKKQELAVIIVSKQTPLAWM